jgi:hypothetical protein
VSAQCWHSVAVLSSNQPTANISKAGELLPLAALHIGLRVISTNGRDDEMITESGVYAAVTDCCHGGALTIGDIRRVSGRPRMNSASSGVNRFAPGGRSRPVWLIERARSAPSASSLTLSCRQPSRIKWRAEAVNPCHAAHHRASMMRSNRRFPTT